MTKEEIVQKAVRYSETHSHIILNWATGVGKSRGAISIASWVNPTKILLIVAETAHKENWKKEFGKWNIELWNRVTVECYASLKNYRDTEWDLLILDEVHHVGSELRSDTLSTIEAHRVIALSATLSLDDITTLSAIFKKHFHVYTITLQDAIFEKILPVPKVYLLPISLDKKNTSEIIGESWGAESRRVSITTPFDRRFLYKNKHLYPAVDLTIRCTQFQKYVYMTDRMEYYKRQFMLRRQEFLKNKWLQAGSARKRFLSECKTTVLRDLLNMLEYKRYICFCGSIEQADLLGGKFAIHSKKKLSQKVIEDFNKGKINHIVAVNMLQEGQNLENIEVGVIAQLDGQERAFIQKFGRTLRAEDPIQIILYFKDTRDEEYLNKALEGLNKEYVYTIRNPMEIPI